MKAIDIEKMVLLMNQYNTALGTYNNPRGNEKLLIASLELMDDSMRVIYNHLPKQSEF